MSFVRCTRLASEVSYYRYIADHLATASEVASRLRLRCVNRHQRIVPRCRLNTYGRRALSIAGPTVWNSLPGELGDPSCDPDSFVYVKLLSRMGQVSVNELIPRMTVVLHTYSTVTRVVDSCSYELTTCYTTLDAMTEIEIESMSATVE